MYGAILGDIIGSRFEFDAPGWTKDFELLAKECSWTDDSVMTVAIAEALMDAGRDATAAEMESACIRSMQKWGRRYPGAGYGTRFIGWLHADHPRAYNSYGNGSAMRVSAAGWLYDTLEKTRAAARATAIVSHDHPEGIKGAECTAAVIFLARTGAAKDEIRDYVDREFGYDLSESLEDMRKRHRHLESCMDALPKALRSFFDGDSYEDVVRNAVSLGGDTDTIAAIAGAMGEAFYGMPLLLSAECRNRIPEDMKQVLDRFDEALERIPHESGDGSYIENAPLDAAYMLFAEEEDAEERSKAFIRFLDILVKRMSEDAYVPMPFEDVNNVMFRNLDIRTINVGDTFQPPEDVRLRMDTMKDDDGNLWLPLFINDHARTRGVTANIVMPVAIYDVLKIGLDREDLRGVVINPFGKAFVLTKDFLQRFLDDYSAWAGENGVEVPGKNSMFHKDVE